MNKIEEVKNNLRNLIELNFWYNSENLMIINKSVDIIEEYFYNDLNKDFEIIVKFKKFFNKKEINFIRDMGIYFDGFDMFEEDEDNFWELFY